MKIGTVLIAIKAEFSRHATHVGVKSAATWFGSIAKKIKNIFIKSERNRFHWLTLEV